MNTNNPEIAEFSISGMSCASCAARIERGLSQTPGISRAVVNFATQTAAVQTVLAANEIEKKIESLGYRGALLLPGFSLEEKHRLEQMRARNRFIAAVFLAIPVLVLGMIHNLSSQRFIQALEAALTLVLLLGPGASFFVQAFRQARKRTASMDTLISLGAGISFFWSCILMWRGADAVYFETASAIVAFVLVGKFIEQRMTWRATSSLGALLQLQPQSAQKVLSSQPLQVETLDLRFIKGGDSLLTRVGERFAADGVIVDGQTEVDESLLTGESESVVKTVGDTVIAGTLNRVSAVTFRAQAVGPQSRLGEIVKFVERTQLSKAPLQRLADRVSAVFVPIILFLSVMTFFVWFFALNSELSLSINAAISVLVVACPCALGLATPIAVAIATGRSARLGILFRDLTALEALHAVRTVVFDKTGTLTDGNLSVTNEIWFEQHLPENFDRHFLLSSVLQIERTSQHPIAVALTKNLAQKVSLFQTTAQVDKIREVVGQGLYAEWHSPALGTQFIRVGRPLNDEKDLLPRVPGCSWVVCCLNGRCCVAWSLRDALRPDAHSVIVALKNMNIRPVLASGDAQSVAEAIANQLEIDFYAELSPQKKADLVKKFQSEGTRVAMLGDGVNDAPALAFADVGIAMGNGTDAAQQTAALTLKDQNLWSLLTAIRLSRETIRNIRQNLIWAFGYNALLIPFAMMGRLTPMWAAAAMAASSLFVVLNAVRLLRFESPKK